MASYGFCRSGIGRGVRSRLQNSTMAMGKKFFEFFFPSALREHTSNTRSKDGQKAAIECDGYRAEAATLDRARKR